MGSFPLKSRGQNAFIRDTHIFSPKWINDAQVSFYRSVFLFTSSLQGVNINEGAGIQGMADLAPDADQGFPTLTITNYSTFTGQSGEQRLSQAQQDSLLAICRPCGLLQRQA